MLELFPIVLFAGFVLEFFDASLGMGYGTLTPILLLMGFPPLEVVFAVLSTSAALSLTAGLMHHGYRNVDFSLDSRALKVAGVLMLFGLAGVLLGVILAVNIPLYLLKAYVGVLILSIGLLILVFSKVGKPSFSWHKLVCLGTAASFNKGMTGGGFGPVLAGGQILSGLDSRRSVAITALVEGVVSTAGIAAYMFMNAGFFNFSLVASLLIGGLLSTPLAVYLVRRMHPDKLRYLIALASVVLGAVTLARAA